MKEYKLYDWQKVRTAIDDRDKIAFSNYMFALQLKGKRDIDG